MSPADATVWLAIFAAVSILLQLSIGVYFYGRLTATVKGNREMSDQNYATLRNEIMDMKQDVKALSRRIYIREFRREIPNGE